MKSYLNFLVRLAIGVAAINLILGFIDSVTPDTAPGLLSIFRNPFSLFQKNA